MRTVCMKGGGRLGRSGAAGECFAWMAPCVESLLRHNASRRAWRTVDSAVPDGTERFQSTCQ
jgi:hypothetical protein